jgi:hypothetical protein
VMRRREIDDSSGAGHSPIVSCPDPHL